MLISKNSYLILGLHTDSDEKIVNKRYKELLNLLSINETGSYETDLPFLNYKKIRSESAIKEAFHHLTNEHTKIHDTFFWFQLVDDVDEKCFSDLTKGVYIRPIQKRYSLYLKTKKTNYLKNYFVAELLLYEQKKNVKEYVSADAVDNIIGSLSFLSDKFWKDFKKIYELQNSISLRDDIINNFREKLPQLLAEQFFDLGEEMNNSKLYKAYNEASGISAKELDDNKKVTDSVKEIESKLNEIKSLSLTDDLDKTVEWLNAIVSEIKKLDKSGLRNSSKVIKLKDEFSMQIRSMGISLFNDHDDIDNSISFIEEAIKNAHSANLKEKLKGDLEQLHENAKGRRTEENLKDIMVLIKEGRLEKALKMINKKLESEFLPDDDKKSLVDYKAQIEENLATHGAKMSSAPSLRSINGCGQRIYGDTLYFTLIFIPVLPIARYNVTENYDGTYSFYGRYKLHNRQKIRLWLAILGLGLWILISIINSESSSYSPKPTPSYSNSASTTSNTTCIGSDGSSHTKVANSYCDNKSTPLGWTCNNGYTAKRESDNSRDSSSWYCDCNIGKFQCSSYTSSTTDSLSKQIDTQKSYVSNMYVDEYSQSSIDAYNAQVDKLNALVGKFNRYMSENCDCSY